MDYLGGRAVQIKRQSVSEKYMITWVAKIDIQAYIQDSGREQTEEAAWLAQDSLGSQYSQDKNWFGGRRPSNLKVPKVGVNRVEVLREVLL